MRAWSERDIVLGGVVVWFLFEGATLLPGAPDVHGTPILLYLVLWPLLADLTRRSIARFGGSDAGPMPYWVLFAWVLGALGAAQPNPSAAVGYLLLTAVAVIVMLRMVRSLPKGSVVSDDPLTKGDDACFKQLRFAARFLPLGPLLSTAGAAAGFWSLSLAPRMGIAGTHLFAIGHLLLLVYALGHLWVPRFSGVPAIAAGAIKGELHSTLLGITGLTVGFLTGIGSLASGLGFFVFVGMFTYMGVLGANIMRRKSPTHRVTPEFVYIPWTFTGVFWLISAVLMGLFLNAVPDALADRGAALRMTHVVAGLLGGVGQLWLGWHTRMGTETPRFQGAMRASFFLYNAGVLLLVWGAFDAPRIAAGGLVLLALALAAYAPHLAKLLAGRSMEPA